MTEQNIYVRLEILCVFLWFLLDGCWLLEWKAITYFLSALAVIVAVTMFRFIKREKLIVLVALADTSWLLCNITWAVGDMEHSPSVLKIAKQIFFAGLFICGLAFGICDTGKKLSVIVMSRLRILKYFQNP